MPLAYYSRAPTAGFWAEHWGRHSVEELFHVAKLSPLTKLIFDALPGDGRVLEGGCGLGQYVLLLRERGRSAVGVDLSFDALRQCHRDSPTAPLAAMDLRKLGFRSEIFTAYISLGVVEHAPEGPDAILREARRVLEPGGGLILSVPYVNAVRRLGAWWIRRRNRRVQEAGGEFYQFAFSQREVRGFIERNGFRVLSTTPYDPARVLRRAWWSLSQVSRTGRALGPRLNQEASGEPDGSVSPKSQALRSGTRRALRWLLYTRPSLHALGHMILFVAVKTG